MATFNYQLLGKTDPVNIYFTLSNGRNNIFKVKTGYTINRNDWSKKKKRPKTQHNAKGKLTETKLSKALDNLRNFIKDAFNDANENQEIINSYWLKNKIAGVTNIKSDDKNELNLLVNYTQQYIENAPYRVNKKGEQIGVKPVTLQKYKTIKQVLIRFENHQKTNYRISDVNEAFATDFYKFLNDVLNYSLGYTGRLITCVKTICLDAKRKGIKTSQQLEEVKGFTEKTTPIFLTHTEIEQISNTSFKREALENAKDWLIIGSYIGQRVSDLLNITNENITTHSGQQFIELIQQKTKKRVIIPLYDKIREVLKKRNWKFPYKIADQKFNEYIKEVAKLSGITETVEGSKLIEVKTNKGNKQFRKVKGKYKKYELVTSHICRRSFASNFYGEIPTAILISITGHSTETQFLAYIGKTPLDAATQFLKYYSSLKTDKLEFTISKGDNFKTGTL